MKPIHRSKIRIWLGTRYFRMKRYLTWWFGTEKIARKKEEVLLPHTIATHQTVLLRKLRNVDMQLQHNKIVNLKLAVRHIDGIVIQPGETFSFWQLVGKPSKRKGYVDGMVLHYGSFKQGTGEGFVS